MLIEVNEHQPKGSMCRACTKQLDDCSALPFASMQVIKRYPDGVKAVKCEAFNPARPVQAQ